MSNVRNIQSAKQRGNGNGNGRQPVTAAVVLQQVAAQQLEPAGDGRLREIGTDVVHVPGTASFRAWMIHACFDHPLTSSATSRTIDEAIQILATSPNRLRDGIIEADATDADAAHVLDAAAASVPSLFTRGGVVVRVVDGQAGPCVADAPMDWLRSAVGVKERDDRGNLGAVSMSRVRAWAQRGQWPSLHRLDAIVHTPFVRADGSLCQSPGYDAQSRVLFAPLMAWDPIDAVPTLAQADAAVALINDLISGFEFDAPASRAAVWSAILCLLQPELWPVPMHIFDATSKGSGKTLLASVCASIGTGRGIGANACAGSAEEFDKVLVAGLRAGARVKLFDNAKGSTRFGTPTLAAYLTAPRDGFAFRVLGASEERVVTPCTAIFVSGNNTTLDEDLGRRSILCRQQPSVADPAARTGFRHDLIGGEHLRPDTLRGLVRAALAVVLWHVSAGRPSMGLPAMGSYDAYTSCVRDPLAFCGIGDPHRKLDSVEEKTVDPAAIAGLWYALWRSRPMRPTEVASEIGRAVQTAKTATAADDRVDALLELGAAIATIRAKRGAGDVTAQDVGQALLKCRDAVTESGTLRKLEERTGYPRWSVDDAPADAHVVPLAVGTTAATGSW
jgi:hypothetical protein